jgi:hypothetical protein
MAPKGRRKMQFPASESRMIRANLAAGASVGGTIRAAKLKLGSRFSQEKIRSYIQDLKKKNENMHTPYGPLVQTFECCGETYRCIHPCAILWAATQACPAASEFYHKHLCKASHARIAIHFDEARLGNILRPDAGRSFQSLSWTLMDLPRWFRVRIAGWFPCTFMPGGEISGKDMSLALCAVLRMFFAEDGGFNLDSIGIELTTRDGQVYVFKARADTLIADMKAIDEVLCLKGSSSYRPCGASCHNVVGYIKQIPAGLADELVHYRCTDPRRFRQHSHRSFCQQADRLEHAKLTESASDFDQLEKACGLIYTPGGLPWDKYLREYLNIPEMVFFDYMHSLTASGGLGQYVVNRFALEACRVGKFTLKDLDDFKTHVHGKKSVPKLGKTFFQDRVHKPTPKSPDAHLKAFSSEVVSATNVLVMFAEHVLQTNPRVFALMAKHIECLKLFHRILCLLRDDGDETIGEELLATICKHNDLYLELWPEHEKPKLHYAIHAALSIIRKRTVMSCNDGERNLRIPKSLGSRVFKMWCDQLVTQGLNVFMEKVADADNFKEVHMKGLKTALPHCGHFMGLDCNDVFSSVTATNCSGIIKKNDVVHFTAEGLRLGTVKYFVQICTTTEGEHYVANVLEHAHVTLNSWSTHYANPVLVPLVGLRPVTYLRLGDKLHTLASDKMV